MQRLRQHLGLARRGDAIVETDATLARRPDNNARVVERQQVVAAGRQHDRPVARILPRQSQMHDLAALRLDRQRDADGDSSEGAHAPAATTTQSAAIVASRSLDPGDAIAVGQQFGVALDLPRAETLRRTQQTRRHPSAIDAGAIRDMQTREIARAAAETTPAASRGDSTLVAPISGVSARRRSQHGVERRQLIGIVRDHQRADAAKAEIGLAAARPAPGQVRRSSARPRHTADRMPHHRRPTPRDR